MTTVSVNDIVLAESNIGYVRYIGPMYNSSKNSVSTEIFVGLELIEATGNNDGSVDGTRYFYTENGQNYGLLVPKNHVEKILTGWDLLKKFREQHNLLIHVVKHWNDCMSALEKSNKHISELENRLDNRQERMSNTPQQPDPYLVQAQSHSSIHSRIDSRRSSRSNSLSRSVRSRSDSRNNSQNLSQIAAPTETLIGSTPNSLYDVRPVGFQPRAQYNIDRFSQASQMTDVPSIPPSYTPQDSFGSDSTGVSSLSGWEYLEQWRAKASADGVLPALTPGSSFPLSSIAETNEEDLENVSSVSKVSSYYINGPQRLRLNEQSSFEYSDLESSCDLRREDSINSMSVASPDQEISVIWGVLSPS